MEERFRTIYRNLRLRWQRFTRDPEVLEFNAAETAQKGQGFTYNQAEFIHHSNLSHKESAFFSAFPKQKLYAAGVLLVVVLGILLNWHGTILIIFAVLTTLYFLDSLFNAFLIYRSFAKSSEIKISTLELSRYKDDFWPRYTVFCPLYKEWQVVPQFVEAMSALDYPKEKLQIMLLLEEDDKETINKIAAQNLPANFEVIVVPDSKPKTKPKAMNYGLNFARGQYLVIYDAEIIPDRDQLKKAVLTFRKFPHLGCPQTRLDHYNTEQNFITRLFNTEFCFYYDLFLPGLQKMGAPVPLSGHSTHFRTSALQKIGAWDPYNVTEDCDIAIRLHRIGFQTGVIDSVSREEATGTFESWIKQRSRWMKGFMQTSIVNIRNPIELYNDIGGFKNFIVFGFIVPGMVAVNLLNMFYWLLLVAWYVTLSPIIKTFFPTPILYMSVVSFVAGNFIFIYLNIIGAYRRQRYGLVKYTVLSPLYWLMLSAATVRAAVQIVTSPHNWEKTEHGSHLQAAPTPQTIKVVSANFSANLKATPAKERQF